MSAPSIVLKFGGTSLGTRGRVTAAVRRIRRHIARREFPVVVVSANGSATDRILGRLLGLARPGAPRSSRELDRALTTGEDLSAALLAFALEEAGVPARSLRAREAGIIGDGAYGSGRIRSVDVAMMERLIGEGIVPVITGFQACRNDDEIVTLGRSGSDTSAVAVAAALGPVPCHIITDVRGVFDRDPAVHPDAVQVMEMTHDALAALTRGGAGVVHPDAAALARAAGVPLLVYHYRAAASTGTRVGVMAHQGRSLVADARRDDNARTHLTRGLHLESGEVIRDVVQAYQLTGELNAARDNVVLVLHALTGSADAAGDWWRQVIGPGKAIDTNRYAVLAPNLLGSCYGTTGPWDAGRRPFPRVTTRDAARLIHHLIRALDVRGVQLAVGGSLGGMVALEWAASFPGLTRSAVIFAAPAAHTAAGIGWNHIQRRVIESVGGDGLEIARMVAMMTYRTPAEFEQRFARSRRGERYEIESYLSHHGAKLRARFDRHSYLALLEMMDSHDVGRCRGGISAALTASSTRITGVGVPGDVLYPASDVKRWTDAAGARYEEIQSIHGHDAFLIEHEQVSAIVRRTLSELQNEYPEPVTILR